MFRNSLSQLSNQQLVNEISRKMITYSDLTDLREELMRRIGLIDLLESKNKSLNQDLKLLLNKLEQSKKNDSLNPSN